MERVIGIEPTTFSLGTVASAEDNSSAANSARVPPFADDEETTEGLDTSCRLGAAEWPAMRSTAWGDEI